jgi:hypothetical protein
MKQSRRDFIRIGALGLGGAMAGGTMWTWAQGEIVNPALAAAGATRRTPTYCEVCFWKCAGWVYTNPQGEIWKIIGNDDDPHCNGRLCPRGTGGVGMYTDEDRLKTPLIRKTVDGKQVFVEASWEEALDTVAAGLQEGGRNARPGVHRPVYPRLRGKVLRRPAPRDGIAQHHGAFFRPVPRSARSGFSHHLRRHPRLARAHRHPRHPLPRADRLASRRKHAQRAGPGDVGRHRQGGDDHHGRPALLHGRQQVEILAAHQAGHRHGPAAGLDPRDHLQ